MNPIPLIDGMDETQLTVKPPAPGPRFRRSHVSLRKGGMIWPSIKPKGMRCVRGQAPFLQQ
jgi:hypothetical protein